MDHHHGAPLSATRQANQIAVDAAMTLGLGIFDHPSFYPAVIFLDLLGQGVIGR
jgi:hypothetical protein